MESINGGYDTTKSSMEDLKARFALYEDGVRDGYLFVQVSIKISRDWQKEPGKLSGNGDE
jgi:hypothetical protein